MSGILLKEGVGERLARGTCLADVPASGCEPMAQGDGPGACLGAVRGRQAQDFFQYPFDAVRVARTQESTNGHHRGAQQTFVYFDKTPVAGQTSKSQDVYRVRRWPGAPRDGRPI
ncbi:MAG: hypothetical protein NTW86_02585 [Candidatus Sumerlaeota bacterium]|nr:hypothetical protein [Candidatus Sumerlaeota bacterium]